MTHKEELLKRVDVIEASSKLNTIFRKASNADFTIVRTFIRHDNLNIKAIKLIEKLTKDLDVSGTETESKSYLVKWEIELTAESPEHAAKLALEIQRDKTSEALSFDIQNQKTGEELNVDLL